MLLGSDIEKILEQNGITNISPLIGDKNYSVPLKQWGFDILGPTLINFQRSLGVKIT